jgi:hypothetical protein
VGCEWVWVGCEWVWVGCEWVWVGVGVSVGGGGGVRVLG